MLLVLLTIFFANPLLHISDHVFSSADIQQGYPATNIEAGYQPRNPLFFDPWDQIEPWLIFSRDTLRTGQIPLWNPYNANGVPHMANYQSAVFSMYSIPYYILPFKWAALLAAWLRLFVLGFFTFLFLKQWKVSQLGALAGGTAFMFSGYNLVWLDWSHIGAVTVLPTCLFFVEALFKHFERDQQSQPTAVAYVLRWPLIGFSLSVTIGMLSGHPETFYFCALLISLYFVFRLATLWRRADNRTMRLKWARLSVYIGLAALQLVPFAEYLANSAVDRRSAIWMQHALTINWPLALYPDLLGNPSQPDTLNALTNDFGNYNEVNGVYLGGAVLYLALLGLAFIRRNRHRQLILFFGTIAFVWLFYAYDLFGVKQAFNIIPGVAQSFSGRSLPIFLFAVSVCAALSLDHLLTVEGLQPQHRLWTLVSVGFGCVLLTTGAYSAYFLLSNAGTAAISDLLANQKATMQQATHYFDQLLTHTTTITISCGLAIVLVGALLSSRHKRVALASAIGLLALVFIQSGWLLRNYSPLIEERFFYPVMPAMDLLAQHGQGKQLLFMQDEILPANVNLVYRLSTTSSNDAIDVKYYDRLENFFFGTIGPIHSVLKFNEIGLKLFGIAGIVTGDLSTYAGTINADAYKLVAKTDKIALIAYNNKLPLYHTVVNALIADSDEQALKFLDTPGFDPAKTVVLSAPNSGPDSGVNTLQVARDEQNAVEVLSDSATDVRLKVSGRVQPGYMVLARTYYPGWKAKVNGSPQPVYRANYAFSAIALQQGDNLIEFYYDPDSFKVGVVISLASLSALVIFGASKFRTGVSPR